MAALKCQYVTTQESTQGTTYRDWNIEMSRRPPMADLTDTSAKHKNAKVPYALCWNYALEAIIKMLLL
jgi:hypothetical protein